MQCDDELKFGLYERKVLNAAGLISSCEFNVSVTESITVLILVWIKMVCLFNCACLGKDLVVFVRSSG